MPPRRFKNAERLTTRDPAGQLDKRLRKGVRRTVSRVLSARSLTSGNVEMIIPLDRPLPDGSSGLTRGRAKHAIAPLFDLAPDRVCRALSVTSQAVGSYPTVSPLPIETEAPTGGLFSVALSVSPALKRGRLVVNQYLCLWSPDFPPARHLAGHASDHPSCATEVLPEPDDSRHEIRVDLSGSFNESWSAGVY